MKRLSLSAENTISARDKDLSSPKWYKKIPKRYFVMFLIFVGNFMEMYVGSSISMIIVDITSDKKIIHNNKTEIIEAQYKWTSMERSLVLSVNFIGITLAVISGTFAHKVGGVALASVGRFGEAFITLISPLVMNVNVYLLIGLRFALGILEGFCLVGALDVVPHWVPPNEMTRLTTFLTLGFSFGLASNFPVAGFVIQNFGWQIMFYVLGVLLLIWAIIWTVFVNNFPSEDRLISQKEKTYLSQAITYVSKEKSEIPYRRIFTSLTTCALINEFFCSAFVISLLAKLMPLYLKDVLDKDTQTIGLLSGIPWIFGITAEPVLAYFVDRWRCTKMRKGRSVNEIHKPILFWGNLLTIAFLLLTVFGNGLVYIVICFTMARVAISFCYITYNVLTIDFSGRYAAFLGSLTMTMRGTGDFVNTLLYGKLVSNHSKKEWDLYIFVLAFVIIYAIIIFKIFGSGELQPWAQVSPKTVVGREPDDNEADELQPSLESPS